MVFSTMADGLDLVTASECALQLMREALRGPKAVPAHRDESIRQLRMAFADRDETVHGMSSGSKMWALHASFLRVDSSFRTRPAAEWAGVHADGVKKEVLVLSRQCPAAEYCVLHGPWSAQFVQLADLAGALLPQWPSIPYPAPLENMDTWANRLAQRRATAAQTFELDMGDGGTETVPGSTVADQQWQDQTPFRGFRGPVTDDRGNAERWVGFVLEALMRRDPEALDVRLGPDRRDPHVVGPWNCVVTLRSIDLFEASVRVIDWLLATSLPPATPVAAALADEVHQDFQPSERQDAILSTMYDEGATSERRRLTRQAIASKVQHGLSGSSIGAEFSELKDQGFLRSREGNKGGCWLTEKGIARAKQIQSPVPGKNP